MSFAIFRKLLSCVGISAFFWLALPTVGWAQQFGIPSVCGSSCAPCGISCQTFHCPPAYQYCYEGGPNIHWHCGCPHPVCNPCELPHWGFYETCWNRWPFPPDWTHCPSPPPAAFVSLTPMPTATAQPMRSGPGVSFQPPSAAPQPQTLPMPNSEGETFPQPRRFDGR